LRLPDDSEAYAPEFPAGLEWLNVAMLRMQQQIGRPVLVEFFDFARINSHRTLPYTKAWHERYADAGLRVIGVHGSSYSFGAERDTVVHGVEQLDIPYAVVLDPDFLVWREYGNRGWPARYIFDARGVLRLAHWGEGEYEESESVLRELLVEASPDADLPDELVEPIRPEDAAGAVLEPQTADVALPADAERVRASGRWTTGPDFLEADEAGASVSVDYRAGAAYAVMSGSVEPGLHETDGSVVAQAPGLRLHGFQFTPLPPSR
jgi:hypothetical protein